MKGWFLQEFHDNKRDVLQDVLEETTMELIAEWWVEFGWAVVLGSWRSKKVPHAEKEVTRHGGVKGSGIWETCGEHTLTTLGILQSNLIHFENSDTAFSVQLEQSWICCKFFTISFFMGKVDLLNFSFYIFWNTFMGHYNMWASPLLKNGGNKSRWFSIHQKWNRMTGSEGFFFFPLVSGSKSIL